MTRRAALSLLRVAGYHDDQHTRMRAMIEGRVSCAAAKP
jgi:hypothetical protein